MQTRKTTIGTSTKFSASMADLGSVVRLYSNNFNAPIDTLILDKTLQLIKTPVAYPVVHNLATSLFPNAFQVFHDNLVSVKIGNNVFAYAMVCVLHPTSFSSREFFKQSLAGTSAFTLKLGTQIFELPFYLFDFRRIIKPAVRSDSEVVYSEVNAENGTLRATVNPSGINLFGECENKKAFVFVHPEQAFINVPAEIIFVAGGDVKIEFLSCLDESQNQSVTFDISTSGKVISDRSVLDYWLGFCCLDYPAGLSHAGDSYLGREFKSPSYSLVDSIMEFKIMSNLMLPCVINAELERFSVSLDSSDYLFSWIYSDGCTNDSSHIIMNELLVYKGYGKLREA